MPIYLQGLIVFRKIFSFWMLLDHVCIPANGVCCLIRKQIYFTNLLVFRVSIAGGVIFTH